jgi:hypothetical protein
LAVCGASRFTVGISPKYGGSFNNNARNVRAAVRNRNNNANNNNGFRVALAHASPNSCVAQVWTPACDNIPPEVPVRPRTADEADQERWLTASLANPLCRKSQK